MTGKTSIEWAAMPGHEGYEVARDGHIRNARTGYELKPIVAPSGHVHVFLNGAKVRVHHAVLLAFVGPCPAGMETRHLNGDAADNHVENLVWGTRQENAADARAHGRIRAARRGAARLSDAQVAEIRTKIGTKSLRAIGAEYGVSHTTIRSIATGRLWG